MSTLSELTGGGSLIKLDPNLTLPGDINSGGIVIISSIDATTSLTTILNLTGKFAISSLYFYNLTNEEVTVKLTIDSEIIWNDTFTVPGTTLRLFGSTLNSENLLPGFFCRSSLLLEFQTATDTSINFAYRADPIK